MTTPALPLTDLAARPSLPPATGTRLQHWLPLPWPPEFFVPGCFCCGGDASGYSCGGVDAFSSAFYSTIDRTSFSTDLTSLLATAALTVARGEATSASQIDVAAYIAGGRTSGSGAIANSDRLTFASETVAAVTTANLSSARYALGAISERTAKAYFAGGFSTPINSIADKLVFATAVTSAATTANLTASRGGLRGMTEGTSKGYWGGGFTGLSSWTTRTDKISFSTDISAAQTTADLSAGRDRYQSVSDGSSKGYFAGGQTGSHLSVCDKVTFATDVTVAHTTATLARINGSGISNGVNGLALGGIDLTGLSKSANKLAFASDSISALGSSSDLSSARTGVTGCSMAAL